MGYTQIWSTKMNPGTGFAGWERTEAWTEQLELCMKTEAQVDTWLTQFTWSSAEQKNCLIMSTSVSLHC